MQILALQWPGEPTLPNGVLELLSSRITILFSTRFTDTFSTGLTKLFGVAPAAFDLILLLTPFVCMGGEKRKREISK